MARKRTLKKIHSGESLLSSLLNYNCDILEKIVDILDDAEVHVGLKSKILLTLMEFSYPKLSKVDVINKTKDSAFPDFTDEQLNEYVLNCLSFVQKADGDKLEHYDQILKCQGLQRIKIIDGRHDETWL